MSNFLSGLRSALTRATSYTSNTSNLSAQSPHEAPEDARNQDDSYINIDPAMLEAPEDAKSTDESQAPSSRTLSFDQGDDDAAPSTPEVPLASLQTPETIFQTAQKDVFKSAFKSVARERDIFMTAKPVRTWDSVATSSPGYDDSPLAAAAAAAAAVADDTDDSSFTMSHTLEGTPSVASKRDRDEVDQIHITSPKRRRTSDSSDEEHMLSVTRIPELDTSALSDDENNSEDDNSGLSSSSEWSQFDAQPPPGLDRKARRNWKRQQRRNKSVILQEVYGYKKPRVTKSGEGNKSARSGFRRSVSGRDILIRAARRRFWEARVGKDVSCC